MSPRGIPLPHMGYCAIFDCCWSDGTSIHAEVNDQPGKLSSWHPAFQAYSRSLEPTLIDLLPMATYWCSVVSIGLSGTVSVTYDNFGEKCKLFLPLLNI